jgi:hypothetical protein
MSLAKEDSTLHCTSHECTEKQRAPILSLSNNRNAQQSKNIIPEIGTRYKKFA